MARGCCTARASNDTPPQAGRRLAVRAAFALLLYTRPRTPFCRCAAFPLKGKQEIVPLTPAPLEMARAQSTAEPCAPLRWQGNLIRRESKTTENQVTRFPPGRRGPQSGAGVLYGKNRKWHPPKSRPPTVRAAFALLLYARPCTPFCRYAAFPLKGKQEIVPLPPAPLEMAKAQSTAEPCAPLRGRGPRSGAGVLYRKSLK